MNNLPSISREDDGYLKSFTVDQKDEYLEFLSKYNFVILQILSEEEADATVSNLFDEVAPNVNVDDLATWENDYWSATCPAAMSATLSKSLHSLSPKTVAIWSDTR
jgi:hypothetical protein